MSRRTAVILTAIVLAAVLATTALAQQQGSNQSNAMREKYKYTFQLMQMVRHIGDIDKNKKYTLTPTQAKGVLGVLKPLRTKPKLTQDQAKTALKNLKKVFTATQLNAMAKIKPKFGQGPGGHQGGQGMRPGGQGGPGGRQNGQGPRHFDPNAMKDFNPFYTKVVKGDKMSEMHAKRWNDFFAALEKKAATKVKPKPKATTHK